MSGCLNRAMLVGCLTADPQVRKLANGSRVVHLIVETTEDRLDAGGDQIEQTQSHQVVVWDSLPGTFGFAIRYLRKGDCIHVEGRIEYRLYDDEDADGRATIKASEVLAAGQSGEGARTGSRGTTSWARRRAAVGVGRALQLSML
ncbi:MAG TPA: single-stranded DNA-binding protein [Longimicrobiaceae bacterium]